MNYINVSDKINKRNIYDIMRNNSILKLKIKNNGSFFKYSLLLSGHIAVNPGPVQFPPTAQKGIPKTHGNDKLDTFEILNKRGLHFIHVNINSILPKIEGIRPIAYSKTFQSSEYQSPTLIALLMIMKSEFRVSTF